MKKKILTVYWNKEEAEVKFEDNIKSLNGTEIMDLSMDIECELDRIKDSALKEIKKEAMRLKEMNKG